MKSAVGSSKEAGTSARKSAATSAENVSSKLMPINGDGVGFPGLSGVDCPFSVSAGIPLAGGLDEISELLNAAYELLGPIEAKHENDGLAGVRYLIVSAESIATSLKRGFESHPLSKDDDGYHAPIS